MSSFQSFHDLKEYKSECANIFPILLLFLTAERNVCQKLTISPIDQALWFGADMKGILIYAKLPEDGDASTAQGAIDEPYVSVLFLAWQGNLQS